MAKNLDLFCQKPGMDDWYLAGLVQIGGTRRFLSTQNFSIITNRSALQTTAGFQ